MERPRGLEPPPTAWQAVVLPLYYGRISYIFIARRFRSHKASCRNHSLDSMRNRRGIRSTGRP